MLAKLMPLAVSLIAFWLLARIQIPSLRRRLAAVASTHPCFLILEVGFIVGLVFLALSPVGFLIPKAGVSEAALMTGFSILAIAGFAAFYIVRIRKIAP